MYYAYILRNSKTYKLYKGHTSDLERRLKEHKRGHTKSTKEESESWEVIYYEEFELREQAIAREKYFKTASGRRFIKSKISSMDIYPNVPTGTGGE